MGMRMENREGAERGAIECSEGSLLYKIAILLSELEADALTIQAGLLCDVLRKKLVTERELAGCVSAELYKLI